MGDEARKRSVTTESITFPIAERNRNRLDTNLATEAYIIGCESSLVPYIGHSHQRNQSIPIIHMHVC